MPTDTDRIKTWRHVSIKGKDKPQIDKLIQEIEDRFGKLGWSRDAQREADFNRYANQVKRFYCWSREIEIGKPVYLYMNRSTELRVRGSTFDHSDPVQHAELADAIESVLTNVLRPAAAAVGLKVSYSRVGPISRVGAGTESAMAELAEASNGEWPLPDSLERTWRNFVVTATLEHVAIDPIELKRWFAQNGWDEIASGELARRFYADASLLSEFEDARQAV